MAPDYDHLTLMQKVEVFEHAVNNTAGDDLAKLLWLKSPSSEVRHSRLHAHAALCHPLLSGGFLVLMLLWAHSVMISWRLCAVFYYKD